MEELLPRNREWKNCCPGPPHAPGNMAFPHTPAFIPGHHHPDLGHLMASLPTAGNTRPLVTLPSALSSSCPGYSGMPTYRTRKPGLSQTSACIQSPPWQDNHQRPILPEPSTSKREHIRIQADNAAFSLPCTQGGISGSTERYHQVSRWSGAQA